MYRVVRAPLTDSGDRDILLLGDFERVELHRGGMVGMDQRIRFTRSMASCYFDGRRLVVQHRVLHCVVNGHYVVARSLYAASTFEGLDISLK